MAGYCIYDDDAVCEASKQEVIRRYYKTACDCKLAREKDSTLEKIKSIMQQLGVTPKDRHTVTPALEKSQAANAPAAALELEDGRIITGRKTQLMSASASAVVNSVKALAGLDDKIMLISPIVLGLSSALRGKYWAVQARCSSLTMCL